MSRQSQREPQSVNQRKQDGGDMNQGKPLSGMDEITDYARRSSVTILDWIRHMSFPARKIGGIWESDTALIDQWRREQILNEVKQKDEKRTAKTA